MGDGIAPGFQGVRYCDVPLLGSENTFELHWGCRPSFGKFRCAQSDYATIVANSENDPGAEVSGNLKFTDGISSDRSVTLKDIRLVKATLNPHNHCYDLVLADRRIDWTRQTGTKDYNIYSLNRVLIGSEYEIEVASKNSGSLWTFQQVLTDLLVSDAPTLADTPDRHPINIRGKGRTFCEILEQIMFQGNYTLLLDPTTDTTLVVNLGEITSGDTTTISPFLDFTYISHDVEPGFGWYPTKIRGWYGKEDGSMDKVDSTVSGGLDGVKSYTLPWVGSTDGIAACQEWCDENASNWGDAVLWKDTWLVGIRPVPPSSEVHTIRWVSGNTGSFTILRRSFSQLVPEPQPQPTHLFSLGGYTAGAGTFAVSLSQTGGTAGNKTTPVSFTYTIKSIDGVTLATTFAPTWPSRSENGLKVAATDGLAWHSGTSLKLFAFERSGTGAC